MIEVTPGQKIPLSYVFAQLDAGKVVKATIQKMDGTVLSTVTLTEVHPGVHSDLSFVMPTGVQFVKAILTPYLSGGVTLDTTNPSTQEVYESIQPMLVSELVVAIGCEDQPAQQPVIVDQPTDKNLLLSFSDDTGAPLDTTNATAVIMSFKKADNTTLTKSLGSGITAVAGTQNQYLVQMLAADFALLPTGRLDAQVELDLAGVHNVVAVYGALQVNPSVLA